MDDFLDLVRKERESQKTIGWRDENNSAFAWVAYIVNYATRFAMPASFDTKKYTFRVCMVKTAALCCAAFEWHSGRTDAEILPADVMPKP